MRFRDGLKQTSSGLDPLSALRSTVDFLRGASPAAATALAGLGIRTVLDLATAPLFLVAAEIASASHGATSAATPLAAIPGGLVVDGGPSDLAALAGADLSVLRALPAPVAVSLQQNLQVDTVAD